MSSFSPGQLRRARRDAGLSPEQVGAAIGRSSFSIREYERGRVIPPTGVVTRLADALHVPVAALFAGEGGDGNAVA